MHGPCRTPSARHIPHCYHAIRRRHDDQPDCPGRPPRAGGDQRRRAGVVFGDIGTSPLYTLKTVLDLMGGHEPLAVLGALSLIVWTLIVVTTVKYVGFAMRVDNDGEGGILALMSLLGVKRGRPIIVAVGLAGAALIYGDGAVTPAISVLSALEACTWRCPASAHMWCLQPSWFWRCCSRPSRSEPPASGARSVRSWRCGSP